ncbi:MAG: cell division protein FtsZ [candidate division Zixibacteria bacterium]|nr:cell division protein FtsZ [candidate division Zixibacteria bacterium]
MLEFTPEYEHFATIKVIGIGGGGGNAVNRMIDAKIRGVEFIVANTDAQVLRQTKALQKVQIGSQLTKGLGAGGRPDVGRLAAEEDRDSLYRALEGSDMIFLTAGMGGGTGTGAAPIIADLAGEIGALAVAVVTRPFHFEGPRRLKVAEAGLAELADKVDTLIIVPNEKLLKIVARETTITESFRLADEVLVQAVRGISDLITVPGLINVDFADVRAVMSEAGGSAIMGTGVGAGEGRAALAAQNVISSPLLDGINIKGARGILINVTGGSDMTLHEINEAVDIVNEVADEDANVIVGAVVEEGLEEFRITVIATGFEAPAMREAGIFDEAGVAASMVHAAPLPPAPPKGMPIDFDDALLGSEFDIPAFIRQRSRTGEMEN